MRYSGITTGFEYPFTSGPTGVYSGSCLKKNLGAFKIVSYKIIENNCTSIRAELQKKPVSTSISGLGLQFYSSGVYSGCGPAAVLDHAVLIMGY